MPADLILRYRILARLLDDPVLLEETECARRLRLETRREEWPLLLLRYPELPAAAHRPTRA